MCVSAAPVRFSGTKIVITKGKTRKRAIIYSNTATPVGSHRAPAATSKKVVLPPALQKNTGKTFENMMFWPVPGVFSSIAPIEAKGINGALKCIEDALRPRTRSMSRGSDSMSFGLPVGKVAIFHTEFYTYCVAERAGDIPGALKKANIKLNLPVGNNYADILKKFQGGYPEEFPIALMLFNPGATTEAAVMLEYDPLPDYDHLVFVPTLDGHGELDLNEDVEMDHTIAIASDNGTLVHYGDLGGVNPDARACLPQKVIGAVIQDTVPNGDLWFSLEDVESGKLEGHRHLPFCSAGGTESRGTLTSSGFRRA